MFSSSDAMHQSERRPQVIISPIRTHPRRTRPLLGLSFPYSPILDFPVDDNLLPFLLEVQQARQLPWLSEINLSAPNPEQALMRSVVAHKALASMRGRERGWVNSQLPRHTLKNKIFKFYKYFCLIKLPVNKRNKSIWKHPWYFSNACSIDLFSSDVLVLIRSGCSLFFVRAFYLVTDYELGSPCPSIPRTSLRKEEVRVDVFSQKIHLES